MASRPDRFEIPADQEMLARIAADALDNGGFLAPSKQWQLDPEVTASLRAMLEALLGPVGMRPVDAAAIRHFEPFLRGIDHLRLCEPNLLVQGSAARWTRSDLGTLMDVNLATSFMAPPDRPPDQPSVCEVGGGYGRVAEAFLNLYPACHYVLVDAVPATLMYAYEYLRAAFPNRRIGSLYAGDEYGPEFDCYVLPAWRADALPSGAFDLVANIESMQEMDGRQVASFIELFDRVAANGATIYVSNARDYVYQGEWPFPVHWETLYEHDTPRSWSANHPTIVMRKGRGDFSAQRAAAEAAFQVEITNWDPRLKSLS